MEQKKVYALNEDKHYTSKLETNQIVNDFFEKIKECELTQIEIFNIVENLTNLELNKLEILYYDFGFFLTTEKDEKEANFTDTEISKAIQKLKEQNKPIPKKKIPNLIKTKTGFVELKQNDNIIDLENLLFPYDFVCCYEFERFLIKEIKKRKKGADDIYTKAAKTATENTAQQKEQITIEAPKGFKDIFTNSEWEIYINALHKVENPVIDKEYNYIGKARNDKGVICSWIKDLQNKGIIKKKHNRQELAIVLNNEISGLNLGKDGKTFDNTSTVYDKKYKEKLQNLIK